VRLLLPQLLGSSSRGLGVDQARLVCLRMSFSLL
jgi:hypothetical protein